MGYCAKGLKPGSWRGGLIVINPVLLDIAFCDITDLVADDLTSVVPTRLHTSLPFKERTPLGTSDRGTKTKTLSSSRLRTTSCPPAIQYSLSGERRALCHFGSSSNSGSREPSAMAATRSGTEEALAELTSRGSRS